MLSHQTFPALQAPETYNLRRDPMVYANGAAFAQSKQGTVFFRDFQPGTYRFSVQAFGTPANLVDTV